MQSLKRGQILEEDPQNADATVKIEGLTKIWGAGWFVSSSCFKQIYRNLKTSSWHIRFRMLLEAQERDVKYEMLIKD